MEPTEVHPGRPRYRRLVSLRKRTWLRIRLPLPPAAALGTARTSPRREPCRAASEALIHRRCDHAAIGVDSEVDHDFALYMGRTRDGRIENLRPRHKHRRLAGLGAAGHSQQTDRQSQPDWPSSHRHRRLSIAVSSKWRCLAQDAPMELLRY